MNAEFLHLETLSSKLCGFNFSNCIVRDSCCPPNMRACKIVFQLCFIILKKFLTFKSIVALFIDNKKKLFMSLLLTFTAALTEVYWPTNITPSWGKSKICVAHWKDRPWKEKVHVQLKTIGQWFTYFVRLNGCVHATGAWHGADHLIILIIVMSHRWEGSSYTGVLCIMLWWYSCVVWCGLSLFLSRLSPVLFFWKLNGTSMSWLLVHIRSYFSSMHFMNQNQSHPITKYIFQTSDNRQGWHRTIQILGSCMILSRSICSILCWISRWLNK